MPVNPKQPISRGSETASYEGRLYLREEELDRAAELVLRAARRFWGVAESVLCEHGLGAAHYRALAAIRRAEGLSVSDLLTALGVRKQSLQRVLGELEGAGLVVRAQGEQDRRERRLFLTDKGREAERAASTALRDRLGHVFRLAGADAVAGARTVLSALAESGTGPDA